MEIFKALHILSMFAMVTTEIGAEFLHAFAISRRDVPMEAMTHRILQQSHIGLVAPFALVSGVVFGLLTAATGGFDFFAGWLIAAYVLVAMFLIISSLLFYRAVGRVRKAAVEAEAGRRPVEDVVREMVASRAPLWFAVDLALVAAIIADMVLKPF